MKIFNANLTVYKDGSGKSPCPSLVYNTSYLYNKVSPVPLNITPTPYLYCNGKFFEYVSANWSVINQIT